LSELCDYAGHLVNCKRLQGAEHVTWMGHQGLSRNS